MLFLSVNVIVQYTGNLKNKFQKHTKSVNIGQNINNRFIIEIKYLYLDFGHHALFEVILVIESPIKSAHM